MKLRRESASPRPSSRLSLRPSLRPAGRVSAWAAAAAAAVLALSACDTATKLSDGASQAPVETRRPGLPPTAPANNGATAGGTPQSAVASVDLDKANAERSAGAAAASAALLKQRVVYFDFDSFAIRDDFKSVIDAHARALAANKARKLVVEGHTDERGGREYNLALGQKRAAAVVQALTLLGASEAQLEAVSFGKEKPAESGSDEAAWAKNRRAELKDR